MVVDFRSVVLRAADARGREHTRKKKRAKQRIEAEKEELRKALSKHDGKTCAREGCDGEGPFRYGLCRKCYNTLTRAEPIEGSDSDKRARPHPSEALRPGDVVMISQLHPDPMLRGQYGEVERPEDDGHAALIRLSGHAACNPNDVSKYAGQLKHVLGALLLKCEE